MALMIFTAAAVYAGCEGDCLKCHPSLKDNDTHASLSTCVNCHNPQTKTDILSFGSKGGEGCGANCFECHSQWPKDGYHADLETCLNCHEGGKKTE